MELKFFKPLIKLCAIDVIQLNFVNTVGAGQLDFFQLVELLWWHDAMFAFVKITEHVSVLSLEGTQLFSAMFDSSINWSVVFGFTFF